MNFVNLNFLNLDSTLEYLASKETRKGIGKYKLCALISHMGSSPNYGHYEAYVKRDNGVWHIFNDEKVCRINLN